MDKQIWIPVEEDNLIIRIKEIFSVKFIILFLIDKWFNKKIGTYIYNNRKISFKIIKFVIKYKLNNIFQYIIEYAPSYLFYDKYKLSYILIAVKYNNNFAIDGLFNDIGYSHFLNKNMPEIKEDFKLELRKIKMKRLINERIKF